MISWNAHPEVHIHILKLTASRNSLCTTTRLWVLKFNRTLQNNNRHSSLLKHLGLLGYYESVGIWQNTNRWTELQAYIVYLSFTHTRKWHVTLGCRCWDLVPLMQIQLADLMKSEWKGQERYQAHSDSTGENKMWASWINKKERRQVRMEERNAVQLLRLYVCM